jgi:GT2 family glycosyltransferase
MYERTVRWIITGKSNRFSFFFESKKVDLSHEEALIRTARVNYTLTDPEEVPPWDPTSGSRLAFLVHALYRVGLGRNADPVGLKWSLNRLRKRDSLESLAKSLTASEEFRSRSGSIERIDLPFIVSVYRDALGRRPEPAELSHWLIEGQNGAKRARVIASLASSEEVARRLLHARPTLDEQYARWVTANDTIRGRDRIGIRAHIARLPFRPVISVVLLTDLASREELIRSVSSLKAQLYTDWELCVPVEPGSEPFWNQILQEQVVGSVQFVNAGGCLTLAQKANAALGRASSDFVTFLRAGDILPEHSLYEVTVALAADGAADIFYTDCDQIDDAGLRSDPWFKPGWDPDLFLAQDYLNNLVVYRRCLIESVGFLRSGLEGAEFYDLALRATLATSERRIQHIPAVLYHQYRNSRAARQEGGLRDTEPTAAAHRAVRDHLDSRGCANARLQPAPQVPGAIEVLWPVPDLAPKVSVIIPTRDRADLVGRCVAGLLHRTDYKNLEILIVDNGSTELATRALFDRLTREDRRIRILIRPGPFNYSALNNTAAAEATGAILLLLNNDIDVLEPGWLREMVSHAIRPNVGVVGAKLLYENGRLQHAGIVLANGTANHLSRNASRCDSGYRGHLALPRSLSAVTGACLAIRRSLFFGLGGLNEELAVSFNDVDLCLRARDRGYRVVWTPFAELYHTESASRGADDTRAKQKRLACERRCLLNKWGPILDSGDPFHNQNLLCGDDDSEILCAPNRQKPWHVPTWPEPHLSWRRIESLVEA